MDEIILSVAPTCPWKEGRPQTCIPDEIIAEAVSCTEEGASVIHLNPPVTGRRPSRDMSSLERIFQGIYDNTDLIIEAGTGVSGVSSLEEKILPATLEGTVFATLDMGSFNRGGNTYRDATEQIRLCLDRMDQYRVKPSLEIFDTGHLAFALHLIDDGLLEPPYNFTFIFDAPWGMSFSGEQLSCLVSRLPEDSNWGVVISGARDFAQYQTASEKGADFLRIGFEYSPWMGGPEVFSNAQLVGELRRQIRGTGREAMSPDDAGHKLLMPR